MGIGVSIVALGKVTVEGGNDGVGTLRSLLISFPLTDAGPTGIGYDGGTGIFKNLQDAVAFCCIPYLFGAWVNEKLCLHGHMFVACLLHDGNSTGKIFIGGVGTGSNEAHLHFSGVIVFLHCLAKLGDGISSIGCERPVNVRLQFGEIDFNQLIVIFFGMGHHFRVGLQIFHDCTSCISDLLSTSLLQISSRFVIERKDGSRRSYLGTHVADGALAGCRKRGSSLAEIFNDRIGTSFYGEDAGYLQNHVLGGAPA